MVTSQAPGQPPGPGVDIQGRTVIDPTVNVKEKLEDTVRRLDDLASMRAVHHDALEGQRRYYEGLLRDAEQGRRQAEKDRLDAIRIIDVTAVARAAQEQNERAQQLAAQLQATAEANRVQVAAAATAFRAELVSTIDPIQKRLEEISRTQYEQQGQKQQVVESRESAGDLKPILDALSGLGSSIRALQDVRERNVGGQQHEIASRDNTRYMIALAGGAVTALTIYNLIKPGGV